MNHGPDGRAEVSGHIAIVPDYEETNEEVVGEDGHADYGVEDEAKEVGEGDEGDAVSGPGAVVVHFRDTSGES